MTLQSQSIRSSSVPRSSETLVRLRRRGQKRLLGMGLLVLMIGAAFIYLVQYRDGGGPQRAKAADATGGPDKTGSTLPTTEPIVVAPAKPAPKPALDLEMASKPRPGQPISSGTLIPNTPLPSETPLAGSSSPAAAPIKATMPPAPATVPAPAVSNPLLPLPGTQTPPQQPTGTTPNAPSGSQNIPEVSGLPADIAATMAAADRANTDRKPVEARTLLNKVLLDSRTSAKDREGVRRFIAQLNQDLVFSPTVYAADTLSDSYKVVSGDNLVKIARKQGSVTESSLIGRINKLANPHALQIGQSLKVLKGPFHAVVSKSAFRMDIFAGASPSPTSLGTSGLPDGAEPGWTYICSFPVGLGEKGATPIANFVVKENKLVNPTWANPRTGEKFSADDPKNPIGERWIGLTGLDEKSKGYSGYGVHGTIQPESIGSEMSMGCVRMKSEDIEVVYEFLMPRVSVVKIVP